MQVSKRYRLREKILAICNDGQQVVAYIPAQTVVDVQETTTSDPFLTITWNGRPYKVFVQDLENRADLFCYVEVAETMSSFVKVAAA
jgi:hypothetical protein